MPENSKANNIGNHVDGSDAPQVSHLSKKSASFVESQSISSNLRKRHSLIKTGVVVSDKMNKTIVVRIDRATRHPVYNKVLKRSKKVKAHDEKNVAKIGDVVRIIQTRPLSKEKRWMLVEVVKSRSIKG